MGDHRKQQRSPLVPGAETEGSGAAVPLREASFRMALGHDGDRRLAPVSDGLPPVREGTAADTSGSEATIFVERSESSVGRHEVQDQSHEGALAPCQRPLPALSCSPLHTS